MLYFSWFCSSRNWTSPPFRVPIQINSCQLFVSPRAFRISLNYFSRLLFRKERLSEAERTKGRTRKAVKWRPGKGRGKAEKLLKVTAIGLAFCRWLLSSLSIPREMQKLTLHIFVGVGVKVLGFEVRNLVVAGKKVSIPPVFLPESVIRGEKPDRDIIKFWKKTQIQKQNQIWADLFVNS